MPKGKYPRASLQARFDAKVKRTESGCHEWQSTFHRDGYGKFWHVDRQVQAHRMAYMIYKGDPGDQWVLHKCDNRKCVNPEHLYLGTPAQNTSDMFERGRAIGNTRTSLDVVQRAQAFYALGFSQQKIADMLGIYQTTISKYVRNAQKRLQGASS
jgi:hypothetical protein